MGFRVHPGYVSIHGGLVQLQGRLEKARELQGSPHGQRRSIGFSFCILSHCHGIGIGIGVRDRLR